MNNFFCWLTILLIKSTFVLSHQDVNQVQSQAFSNQIEIPSLIECLYSIQQDVKPYSREANLWKVHQGWIKEIISFVQEHKSSDFFYPKEKNHPIYYFDREDAREILKPIFKNLSTIDLTDEIINHVFLEKVPFRKDDSKQTAVEFFKTEAVKEESFRIALKTYEYAQGNLLIILGQTPAYVGEMVKIINAHLSNDVTVINVPFSGRPNYLRSIRYKKLWASAFLDCVTPQGEKNFRELLTNKEFSPTILQKHPAKVFIMDNSSGASVSCFMAFLKKWCNELEASFPELVFLEMCDARDFTVLNEEGEWINAEKPDLCFDESLKFEVPVIFLGMNNEILNAFDKMYDNLRIVPSFNGINWHKNYHEKLLSNYPTPQASELIAIYQEYARECLAIKQE